VERIEGDNYQYLWSIEAEEVEERSVEMLALC